MMNNSDIKINLHLESGKNYLLFGSVIFVAASIVLFNLNILPFLRLGDFIFFIAIAFAFALWRLGWCFLFFGATLALEIIDYSWAGINLTIRPYQMFAALLVLTLIIRFVIRRPVIKMPTWIWVDSLPIIFVLSGIFSGIYSATALGSLKYALISGSFAVLYYLTRIFMSSRPVVEKVIPYFLSAGAVVVLYGIWQNIAFQNGGSHYEIMPGRPNSTFAEPDWLGIYLVFLIAVILSILYFYEKNKINISDSINHEHHSIAKANIILLYCLLFFVITLLILTVSRSAWLGALATSIVFLILIFTDPGFREMRWKKLLSFLASLVVIVSASIVLIYASRLSDFQLFNRIQSTGSGFQKITVACQSDVSLPEAIDRIDDLKQFDCQFIRLEDISGFRTEGFFIKEVYRPDPNVSIRNEIYRNAWKEIATNPVLGAGWERIPEILGKDERGTALNASNIFLEIWLGAGIIGLLSFSVILIYILVQHAKNIFRNNKNFRIESSFALLGLFALLIPNFFNAGIFMGILWFYLALAVSLGYKKAPAEIPAGDSKGLFFKGS
jgi:hypothetical protein